MAQGNYPAGWLSTEQYHPEQNLSKARTNSAKEDYLNVAQRLVWFIREQRQMIAAGVATCSFVIQTKIVELDSQAGSCTCEAYIRDCLGNEASDIGTETRADFKDFAEKAATKAKGRALLSLGYGTAFAPELDEGERIVDAPREQKPTQAQTSKPAQKPQAAKPTPIKQEPKQTIEQRKETLKAGFAALGITGEAWIIQCEQATGRKRAELAKGFTEDDLTKVAHRLQLRQDGKTREEAKAS